MASRKASRRCLYLEALPHHEENFPHWIQRLGRAGCTVDLYAQPAVHAKGILGHCRLDGYRLFDLERLPKAGSDYDFVLLGSLRGRGFNRELPPAFRRPLEILAELDLPSISVIHEPAFWNQKFPLMSFLERRNGGADRLHLHRQGTLHRENRPWAPNSWNLKGDRLELRLGRQTEILTTSDGGATFAGPEGEPRLERLPEPEPTLEQHLASKRHRLFTLTRHGASHLRPLYGDVGWVHPTYFGDFGAPRPPERRIVFPGVVDASRKCFAALFAAASELRRLGMPLYIVGGEREESDFAASPGIRQLRQDLERHGLSDVVRFTGPLSYVEYFDFVRRSSFVLPLVDETVEGGAYLTKLSTGVALAIAFGVPMVLSERIAGLYDLELATSYPDGDLGAGLAAAAGLSDAGWEEMRRRLFERRDELARRGLETLRRTLDEIL